MLNWAYICDGAILESLTLTEKRVLQEMAKVMLEIIQNGGPLLESEARGMKGGLRTLIDEADLEQGRLRLGIETKGAGEGK